MSMKSTTTKPVFIGQRRVRWVQRIPTKAFAQAENKKTVKNKVGSGNKKFSFAYSLYLVATQKNDFDVYERNKIPQRNCT
jgi:hypothetical protein